jgi:hypothetical protein
MKIAFLTNHISYGGTEVALYDYAHFNELLLGNQSTILTRDFRQTHSEIYAKFEKRFPMFYITQQSDIDKIVVEESIDCLYVIKSGEVDWFYTTKCKTIVHCVFTTRFPHGSVYCAISDSLNKLHSTDIPVLPHMIHVDKHSDSFRHELGIPDNAVVIGRYGSYDSFDIPFVHDAVVKILNKHPNMYFLTMNTKPFANHPRILYLPRTTDLYVKRKFINTCDVMLHARQRGETFGLSCGEFAVCGKPILTYSGCPERAHIETLGNQCIQYTTIDDLLKILASGSWKIDMSNNGYERFNPKSVMNIFDSLVTKLT